MALEDSEKGREHQRLYGATHWWKVYDSDDDGAAEEVVTGSIKDLIEANPDHPVGSALGAAYDAIVDAGLAYMRLLAEKYPASDEDEEEG